MTAREFFGENPETMKNNVKEMEFHAISHGNVKHNIHKSKQIRIASLTWIPCSNFEFVVCP